MQTRAAVLIAIALALAVTSADAKIHRSAKAVRDFKHTHPCPANGHRSGPCPGYVVDHRIALKRGGADKPSNMQWQTKAAAKAKDKWE